MDIDNEIKKFINKYPIDSDIVSRIPNPKYEYMGDELLNKAKAAILAGKNILLVGEKSTGKNVLAENLAKIFNRPLWNISFHISLDAASLIGDDTLENSNVVFRKGPITKACELGGFAVLDEINMAKNEAMAVLHSVLDYRREIDIPGYKLIKVHPACRFIGTMNYGYEGTRDLNEALLSRFVIIKMSRLGKTDLKTLFSRYYPFIKDKYLDQLVGFFYDLIEKTKAHEISEDTPDLRGIFDGLDMMDFGLNLKEGLEMGLINKIFDPYEADLVNDLIKSRFADDIYKSDLING